jgi:hypothetical protein
MPDKKISEKKRLIFYLLLFVSLTSLLIAFYLGVHLYQRVSHRPPPIPRQTDVTLIQEWMTVPFIARSYRVPENELFEYLKIDSQTDRRLNLVSLSAKKGLSTHALISQIQKYITQFQSRQDKTTTQ